MKDEPRIPVQLVQTGVRMEKRILKDAEGAVGRRRRPHKIRRSRRSA